MYSLVSQSLAGLPGAAAADAAGCALAGVLALYIAMLVIRHGAEAARVRSTRRATRVRER